MFWVSLGDTAFESVAFPIDNFHRVPLLVTQHFDTVLRLPFGKNTGFRYVRSIKLYHRDGLVLNNLVGVIRDSLFGEFYIALRYLGLLLVFEDEEEENRHNKGICSEDEP